MEQASSSTSVRLNSMVNGRLGSLSLPRDLTLGGTRTNKKVYKPNLNVVRNKDKSKEPIRQNQRKYEKRQNIKSPRGRQNNVQSGRYIQSTSVFSEGGAEVKNLIRSDRYLSHRDHEPAAAMEVPAIIKTNWDVDKKAEAAIIDELLADDEGSSSDDDVQYMPVVLPLKINKIGFKKHFEVKKEPKIENDLKLEVKKEPVDDVEMPELPRNEDSSSGSVKMENGPIVAPIKEETDFTSSLFNGVKKYDDDDLNISLIKMPDCLPGKGFLPDSEESTDFTLDQMVEGQIGKILVRKSGKIDVIIGNTRYNLEAEEPPYFREEVMAMPDEKSMGRDPTVVHLTSITDRFVLSPSWEHLFLQGKIKKKQ